MLCRAGFTNKTRPDPKYVIIEILVKFNYSDGSSAINQKQVNISLGDSPAYLYSDPDKYVKTVSGSMVWKGELGGGDQDVAEYLDAGTDPDSGQPRCWTDTPFVLEPPPRVVAAVSQAERKPQQERAPLPDDK